MNRDTESQKSPKKPSILRIVLSIVAILAFIIAVVWFFLHPRSLRLSKPGVIYNPNFYKVKLKAMELSIAFGDDEPIVKRYDINKVIKSRNSFALSLSQLREIVDDTEKNYIPKPKHCQGSSKTFLRHDEYFISEGLFGERKDHTFSIFKFVPCIRREEDNRINVAPSLEPKIPSPPVKAI